MDVLLVNPPNIFFESKQKMILKKGLVLYPPLSLMSLAAMLKKEKIDVVILDVIAECWTISEVKDFIRRKSVKIIGITSTTPQIRGAVQLARSIKEEFGDKVKIILGGCHVSLLPNFIHEFKMFDVGILGEGEYVLLDVVKKALKGESVEGIYRAERIDNLDSLPFPDRDLINQKLYYIEPFGNNFATIHTMRGCPFGCVFCSNPIGGRKIVYRSVENVVDEIEYCVKQKGAKGILFTDDTFTLNMDRTAAICEAILKRKIKVKWICGTRANLVVKELLLKMRSAGCMEVQFGVETGSERLRNEVIKKNVSDEAIIKAFSLCRKLGLETSSFCMLGFPHETKEDMKKTLEFNLKIKPDILGLHLTVLFPNTQLYNQALTEGKVGDNHWTKYALGEIEGQPIYMPDELSIKQLHNIQKYIYGKYYFRPEYLLYRLFRNFKYWSRLRNDINVGLQLFFKGRTSTGRP